MKYTQVKKPNLDPYITQKNSQGKEYILTDWLGWCQAYVEQAYGWKYGYSTALDCWKKSLSRRTGKEPVDVYIPLYYKGYVVNGVDQGHTLIAKFNANGSGTAWTSPRTHKPYADKITFSNVYDLHKKLRAGWSKDLVYLGWSEHVGKNRVIKEDKVDGAITITPHKRLVQGMLGRYPTEQEIARDVNKVSANQVIMNIYDWAVKNKKDYATVVKAKDAQIAKLKAELSNAGIDQETKDTIKETNAIVKLIKELLNKVFK